MRKPHHSCFSAERVERQVHLTRWLHLKRESGLLPPQRAAVYWISPPCNCFTYAVVPAERSNICTGLSCSLAVFTEVSLGLIYTHCKLHVRCEWEFGLPGSFGRSYFRACCMLDKSISFIRSFIKYEIPHVLGTSLCVLVLKRWRWHIPAFKKFTGWRGRCSSKQSSPWGVKI